MDNALLYVLLTYENRCLLHELTILFTSGSSYPTFPYSASQSHNTYDDGSATSMTNVDVQDEQVFMSRFMFNFPTTGIQANHDPQHRAWHGSRGSYGCFFFSGIQFVCDAEPALHQWRHAATM
jgi:hypothetical protein